MYSRLGVHLNGVLLVYMWQSLQECRVKGVSRGRGGVLCEAPDFNAQTGNKKSKGED